MCWNGWTESEYCVIYNNFYITYNIPNDKHTAYAWYTFYHLLIVSICKLISFEPHNDSSIHLFMHRLYIGDINHSCQFFKSNINQLPCCEPQDPEWSRFDISCDPHDQEWCIMQFITETWVHVNTTKHQNSVMHWNKS